MFTKKQMIVILCLSLFAFGMQAADQNAGLKHMETHDIFDAVIRKYTAKTPEVRYKPVISYSSFLSRSFDQKNDLAASMQELPCNAIDIQYGTASLQGSRPYQEDRSVVAALDKRYTVAAVFDGHRGYHCAEYLQNNLAPIIKAHLPKKYSTKAYALYKSFATANADFYNKKPKPLPGKRVAGAYAGSTAALALIDKKKSTVTTAHIGDSRIVKNNGIPLTVDHTPSNPKEVDRITAQHKNAIRDGELVNSKGTTFPMTRAFGDYDFHEVGLTGEPTVCTSTVKNGDFLVLASDGIWDVLSNEEVANFVQTRIDQEISPDRIAREICLFAANLDPATPLNSKEKEAVKQSIFTLSDANVMAPSADRRTGHDNQTAVIVKFKSTNKE
jgi:serine/threonine protein phosphatase PrpC